MSTPTKPRPSSRTRARPFRTFHRYTGLVVAIPVILLVVSGVPLLLTDQLGLGRHGPDIGWLQSTYGIHAPAHGSATEHATQVGDQVFVAERTLNLDERLLGSHAFDHGLLLVTAAELLVLASDASIAPEHYSLPATMANVAFDDVGTIVGDGERRWRSDDLGLTWRVVRAAETSPVWETPQTGPVSADHAARYRAQKLSWERVLQDLHSGRLFGAIGEWIMGLAGLALICLALSGATYWWLTKAR